MTIKGLIYGYREVEHEDDRRALFTVFNGDIDTFAALQVKFMQVHKDALLGGHYHNYRELFYMFEGEATFDLKDTNTGETKKFILKTGYRLLIPKQVAHKVHIKKGSILVGCTEEKYVSPEKNDHKYDF